MAVFAANDNIIKFLGMYNPFQIMFFSGLALTPLVLAKMALEGEAAHFRPHMPKWMAIRCAVNLVNTVFVVYAFGNLPLAQAYAIFFTMPLLVTVLAAWLLREPISLWRGVAVLAGFVGVVMALQPGQIPLTWVHLAAGLGALTGALNYVILRKTANIERPVVNIIYPMMGQLAAATLVLPFVYTPMPLEHLALTGAMALCAFVGSVMIIAAYRAAPAIVVAPMQYSQILWAALTAAFIFDESISAATWAGLAVIIVSGLFILNSSQQRA